VGKVKSDCLLNKVKGCAYQNRKLFLIVLSFSQKKNPANAGFLYLYCSLLSQFLN
jgi:hypothetical protein